ncbi:hypothetical protein BN179_3040015 [Clostridioides difficile T6]|nr:hypothetical protein PHICD211_20173 [Clostridium phage phiCD211]CCL12288.1 hypothetical protein BN169_780130 [Clostridioides difficile E16]CCL28400.1 hypothetical protein BN173_4000025 [Clostridioides difficile T11]CCL51133.1 hypothetical protein BN179_3040015 [Clostridioides difficile T6]CCL55103.1 hypothetical protein BN180_2590024 [Clostridioides difficile E14]CCL66975.1 hypothetical protein BN183_3680032 [Clostridioides difficile E7]
MAQKCDQKAKKRHRNVTKKINLKSYNIEKEKYEREKNRINIFRRFR